MKNVKFALFKFFAKSFSSANIFAKIGVGLSFFVKNVTHFHENFRVNGSYSGGFACRENDKAEKLLANFLIFAKMEKVIFISTLHKYLRTTSKIVDFGISRSNFRWLMFERQLLFK